jgi:hypothetical protein
MFIRSFGTSSKIFTATIETLLFINQQAFGLAEGQLELINPK